MSETVMQNAAPTKIVSARLPIPEYIKFLTAATEAKMSVSEFFYYKIYQDDKISELAKALSEAKSREKDLEEMVSEYRGYAEQWKKTADNRATNETKLQSEVSTLKTQISALNEAEKRFKGEITTDGKNIAELNKTVTELKTKVQQAEIDRKKLMEIIAQWSDKYSQLKALGKQVWDEVYKHNKNANVFYDLNLEKIVNKLK